MSLGSSGYTPIDDAVNALVDEGVTVVVAAGNDGADSCNYSPGRASKCFNVGSSTSTDSRSSFSNYGTCVDIFAPGSTIYSAWYTGDNTYAKLSGTSMAAPHVCGATALYLNTNPNATPAEVEDYLVNNSSPDELSNIGTGSPNKLLYVGSQSGPTPPTPTPPTPTPPTPTPPTPTPPSPTPNTGEFLIESDGSGNCIQVASQTLNAKMSLAACDSNNDNQLFDVDEYGHIFLSTMPTMCISKKNRAAKLSSCGSEFTKLSTMWTYNAWDNAIHFMKNGLFVLDTNSRGQDEGAVIKVKKRNVTKTTQLWRLR
jgi:hypothetical protein